MAMTAKAKTDFFFGQLSRKNKSNPPSPKNPFQTSILGKQESDAALEKILKELAGVSLAFTDLPAMREEVSRGLGGDSFSRGAGEDEPGVRSNRGYSNTAKDDSRPASRSHRFGK